MSLDKDLSVSSLSLSSDDWDRSETETSFPNVDRRPTTSTTPNSVVFPIGESNVEETRGSDRMQSHRAGCGGRSLSELMRLHAEKGTDVRFNTEEALRVADVLKQWINSGTSPYEGEDDFFTRVQDDASWRLKRSSRPPIDVNGRPRGQSESLTARLTDSENARP